MTTNTIFADMLKDIKIPESEHKQITVDAIDNIRGAIESGRGFVLATETSKDTQSLLVHGMGVMELAQAVVNIFEQRPEVGLMVALSMTRKGRGR
jgi:hypothetical protein